MKKSFAILLALMLKSFDGQCYWRFSLHDVNALGGDKMTGRFVRRLILLVVTLSCVFTMNVGISESEPIYYEGTMISHLMDRDAARFNPIIDVDWGMPFDEVIECLPNSDAFRKESEAYDENLVSKMPNGHISVRTNIESVFEGSEASYTTTFVFSEDGLYACNMRSIFTTENDFELRKALSEISMMIGQAAGMTDSNGEQIVTDYSECDMDNLKISYVWTAEDGTFIALQMVSFMDSVIVDINTGLISYFTKLLNN